MELDWSEQSPHIRTLFRPWRPGDGYDEATLQAAGVRLGVRLPAILWTFYRAWGKRSDLTAKVDFLQSPDGLVIRAGTLIFWVENQASCFWGMPHEALEEDPPVVITEAGPTGWEVESKLNWKPSHHYLSSFLDDMTYMHAFAGGAIHGGWIPSDRPYLPADQVAWLEENWSKATVSPLTFGLMPDVPNYVYPSLYIREGQAFWWGALAAREAKVVDEIAQRFKITWTRRW